MNSSKTCTPLLSTFRSDDNHRAHADQSIASYDYIRDLRRCVLQIDREKGLGFVLSATDDYDHTITSVDKVCIRKKSDFTQVHLCLIPRVRQRR